MYKRRNMDKKERLLKKLHIKDETNRLEKILEKKSFSLDTKNLLLSMVYKIQNGYRDYQKTKVQVCDRNDFLEKVIHEIDAKCQEITLRSTPLVDEKSSKFRFEKPKVNFLVDKEQGKITCLGNELTILNAILQLGQKMLCTPEEEAILQIPISYVLNLGMRMHEVEVIRDFNGWSWDIMQKDIENIQINLVFQTILYLLGIEFMTEWIENESKLADYLMLAGENLKQNYGEERSKKIIQLFCRLVIELTASKDEEQLAFWKKVQKENEIELEKLSNKQNYIEEITKEKKELTKQIEKIDKILNNKEFLENEYQTRNEKLPNKEKIFSIRHLVKRLEQERLQLTDKIKEYNLLIEPKQYVARKEKVSKNYEFLSMLDLEGKMDRRKTLLELCLLFLECFEIKVIKAQTKQELLDAFYELRYYRFLIFEKEGTKLGSVEKLQDSFEKMIHILVEKAQKSMVIDFVTEDKEVDFAIIRNIFDSKLIDLDQLMIETKVENGKLYVLYFDGNIPDAKVEIQSKRTVKLKKRTKLFL